jgi:hypothetical protein
VLKHHLTGPQKGTTEVFASGFPGYCDGINFSEDGKAVYVAIPTLRPLIMMVLPLLPDIFFGFQISLSTFVRNILIRLPPIMRPKPGKSGAVLVLDATDGSVREEFYDLQGDNVEMVTAVSEKHGKLYLGSLSNSYVGVFDPKL